MHDTDVAAKSRRDLDARFLGRRFAVFYRVGDGPKRDIAAVVSAGKASFHAGGELRQQHSNGEGVAGNDLLFGDGLVSDDDLQLAGEGEAVGASTNAGAVEFLRVEAADGIGSCINRVGSEGQHGVGRSAPSTVVSLWAVGRVSLRVEARSFDQPLAEDSAAAAEESFMSSWALRMQVIKHRNVPYFSWSHLTSDNNIVNKRLYTGVHRTVIVW